jgi:hypothetical protein
LCRITLQSAAWTKVRAAAENGAIRPRCGHKISSIASQFGVPAPNRLLVAVDFT